MKVLLVSSGSGSRGGGEIYLRNLAQGLSALGCEVHALVPSDPVMDELAASLSEPARVHRLDLRNTYRRPMRSLGAVADLGQRRRASAFIERLAPDIVHLNQQVAEDALDLMLAAREARRPCVSTIHVTHSAAALGARMGALRDLAAERVLRRLAVPLVVVSAASRATLLARRRLASADATVVHCGIPPADGEGTPTARERARREWDVAESTVVIGAVGRIEDQKNPLFAADRVAELLAAGRDVRLVWIGDGALRADLQARAAERGIADRLVVDGWRDDARLRMAGLDILVMPSRFEGLPLALLEAMHAGLPGCVSDADGMPEAVTDGRDGLVRPLSDPGAWVTALKALIDDGSLRGRLGAAARETARTRFSRETMARATLSLYERTVTQHSRTARAAAGA